MLAEHRVDGPVLGLALDGVGLGTDGTAWGGELLRVDGARCERLGRLRPLRLPGGDRAAREPWRMAAAALALAGRGDEIARRFADEPAAAAVATMLARGFNAPQTSSMGRWFDAAAGLLGVCRRMAFEGQAAMLLEGLAESARRGRAGRSLYAISDGHELDLSPLLACASPTSTTRGFGAALFHATLVAALADWVARAAERTRLATVAARRRLLAQRDRSRAACARALARAEPHVARSAQAVPPNDGGLALGQAWVALDNAERRD